MQTTQDRSTPKPTMRAAVYHGIGDVRLAQVATPEPGPGELLIRVGTSGICGSDVGEYVHEPLFFPVNGRHPHSGHSGPTIPGHEFSGRVAAVGVGVEGFRVGDLVAVGAGVWCGECRPCRAGNTNMCNRYWTVGLHADGGLAEYATVPAICAFDVSAVPLSADLAALCQPMSIAVHATRRGRVTAGEFVTVLGTGGIGSFITYAAIRSGALVTVVDLDPTKLAAAGQLGAHTTIDGSGEDIDDALARLPRPDVVFECTARPDSLLRGLTLVRENGRLVVVGHQPDPVAADFKSVSMGEREIIGTMAHTFAIDFPRAVDLIALDPAVWRAVAPTVYPLADIVAVGLEPMSTGRSSQIKLLFDPSLTAPRPLNVST